jgi:hypothetical protein
MTDTYNNADIAYFHQQARHNLKMAKAFSSHPMHKRTRIVYQGRAADYRECIVDQYRRKAGWTLAERVAGHR